MWLISGQILLNILMHSGWFSTRSIRFFDGFFFTFFTMFQIANGSVLPRVMVWCLVGTKPFPEPVMAWLTDARL